MGEIDFVKYLGFVLVTCVFLIGCGGSKSGDPGGGCCGVPGINVDVVSPAGAAAIDDNPNLTLAITVKVTNDSANAGVTWTLTPAILKNQTETLTGQTAFSATYTPPDYSKLPSGVTFPLRATVTATSVTDPTRSAAIPITIYPPLVEVTTSANFATAFLKTNYTCIQQPISGPVHQITCLASVAGGVGPYTWSLGSSVLPPGLQLAPAPTPAPGTTSSTEIIGIPTASGIYPFSLTATDATGNATTASFNINVAPAQLNVPTPTVMTYIAGLPYAPIQLQASGGVPPYTWTLATGSATPPSWLSLSPGGVISGTPPQDFSASYGFAVQVTDSQSPVPAQAVFPTPAASGGSIVTLAAPGDEIPSSITCQSGNTSVQANTPYAFVFSGFDTNGPVTFSGSFTADTSGNLTGTEDIIRSSGAQLAQPLASGSFVLFANNGRGCLTLNTSSSTAQFSLAPTTLTTAYMDGNILEFDDTNGTGTRGSGYFHVQNQTAFTTPASAFAFRFSGRNARANHFAMAGTAQPGAQNGSFSVSADVNDGGSFSAALTGGATIDAPDSNGRGAATLSVGGTNYDLIYYVVDTNHLIFNSARAISSQALITGEASASQGPFSQATLSNSHIYRFGGEVPGSPDVGVGVLHFDGSAAVSGTNYERSGGTTSATTISAQYSVDPSTGRFSFSGTGVPVVGYAVPSASGITGYVVGTGASAASGTMEFQTNSYPPGYQFGPISGTYGMGTEEMLDPQSTVIGAVANVGLSATIPTADNYYVDSSNLTGLFPLQEFELFKYTWSADGTGTWGGNTYMVANQSKFFYIDTSPLNGHPAVVVGQKQQ